MELIRLRAKKRYWGFHTGAFGFRAFCFGWFAVGPFKYRPKKSQ